MNRRLAVRIAISVATLALIAVAGVYGYNLGVARGLADAGRFAAAAPAGAPVFYPYPYYHPFVFFPFFPLLFLLFFLFVARAVFWRGGWRGCRGEVRPDRG